MLFYFIRHGQTDANVKGLLAGAGMDHSLNPEGHLQAQRLAKALKSVITHPIHRLVASNMTRTKQTAEYIAQAVGLPIEFNADFREWHLGEWEGQTFEAFGAELLGTGEPKNGETRKIFYGRVEQAWRRVHHDSEPYLVISHGAVWLAMQDLLKIPRFKINNCDLVKVQSSGTCWSAEILKIS